MNRDTFTKMVRSRQKSYESKLFKEKEEEYANDAGNRLVFFTDVAAFIGKTPEEVGATFLMKHVFSLVKMANGKKKLTREAISEKVDDCINYVLLLEGLLVDRGIAHDKG